MISNLPIDLRAEALLGYLPRSLRKIALCGSHKRNAYEDMLSVTDEDNGEFTVSLARNGLYDILPEGLFHPIDRFDNIPANEYKERFKEECELEQIEEENARRYFKNIDTFITELSTLIAGLKTMPSFSSTIESIICDKLPKEYCGNRFVDKTREFLPKCSSIRGNKALLTLMLRYVLKDECMSIAELIATTSHIDNDPTYNSQLDITHAPEHDYFLGNEFDEDVVTYVVEYWNDDECDHKFLDFVEQMQVYEAFLNDFFMSIEMKLKFDIRGAALPVRLSDDAFFTYLDFNTNL